MIAARDRKSNPANNGEFNAVLPLAVCGANVFARTSYWGYCELRLFSGTLYSEVPRATACCGWFGLHWRGFDWFGTFCRKLGWGRVSQTKETPSQAAPSHDTKPHEGSLALKNSFCFTFTNRLHRPMLSRFEIGLGHKRGYRAIQLLGRLWSRVRNELDKSVISLFEYLFYLCGVRRTKRGDQFVVANQLDWFQRIQIDWGWLFVVVSNVLLTVWLTFSKCYKHASVVKVMIRLVKYRLI